VSPEPDEAEEQEQHHDAANYREWEILSEHRLHQTSHTLNPLPSSACAGRWHSFRKAALDLHTCRCRSFALLAYCFDSAVNVFDICVIPAGPCAWLCCTPHLVAIAMMSQGAKCYDGTGFEALLVQQQVAKRYRDDSALSSRSPCSSTSWMLRVMIECTCAGQSTQLGGPCCCSLRGMPHVQCSSACRGLITHTADADCRPGAHLGNVCVQLCDVALRPGVYVQLLRLLDECVCDRSNSPDQALLLACQKDLAAPFTVHCHRGSHSRPMHMCTLCLHQTTSLQKPTKFDECVWPRHRIDLRAVQPPKLVRQLLQILVRQLPGVALR
jgi:hypothetical protein